MSINPSGLSDEDERKLLELLQSQPDFECLPIPAYWFKKYGIAPREAVGPREYIASNYAMEMANKPKDLPPIIIDEPQQGGKLVPLAPPDDTKVEVVQRPFNWKGDTPFPAIICPTEEEMANTIKHTVNARGTLDTAEFSIQSAGSPASQACTSHTSPDPKQDGPSA